ncbi:MAG: hypothetical protein MJZ12_01835 [Prevotella sp.]|nr:hypothetical protein [Prevotella sp.]
MEGYIKLSRKLLKWGWYGDPFTKAVFLDILLNANYQDGEYRGHKVLAGECVIGRKKLADRLGMSERNVRTALKHLQESGEISTIKSTNRFTIVKVEKWGVYQGWYETSDQQDDQQATNKRPTSDQQVTTSNKGINNKGISNNYYSYSDDEKKRRARELDAFLEDTERRMTIGFSADDNDGLR